MDIITDFGSVVVGSSPARSTKFGELCAGRKRDGAEAGSRNFSEEKYPRPPSSKGQYSPIALPFPASLARQF